eukprot:1305637-Rhodomonas_salina.1
MSCGQARSIPRYERIAEKQCAQSTPRGAFTTSIWVRPCFAGLVAFCLCCCRRDTVARRQTEQQEDGSPAASNHVKVKVELEAAPLPRFWVT